jgi:polyisoprenoid-binding protein YceI
MMKISTKRTWGIKMSVPAVLLVVLLAACAPTTAPASIPNTGNTPTTAAPAATVAEPTATTSMATDSANPTATTTASSGTTSVAGGGVEYVIVPEKSSASYAVREQLARLNAPSDAVGKTSSISGSVIVHPDGSIDAASKFTVDLSTLQTDSSMRDNYVRRAILQTAQYPQAVFVPTQVSGLPAALPQNGSVSFKVTGNMTLHNVTKPLTWDVTGTITNGEALGTATTSFTFEDFGLNQPSVPVVLSVVNKINLSVTVDLKPSGK